jgi:hypothetical protein
VIFPLSETTVFLCQDRACTRPIQRLDNKTVRLIWTRDPVVYIKIFNDTEIKMNKIRLTLFFGRSGEGPSSFFRFSSSVGAIFPNFNTTHKKSLTSVRLIWTRDPVVYIRIFFSTIIHVIHYSRAKVLIFYLHCVYCTHVIIKYIPKVSCGKIYYIDLFR